MPAFQNVKTVGSIAVLLLQAATALNAQKIVIPPKAPIVVPKVAVQPANTCGFVKPPKSMINKFASTYEAQSVANTIVNKLKLNQNFVIEQAPGIENCYAVIERGRRMIRYDNDFLERTDQMARTKWASISIMAHEIGHHVCGHTQDNIGSTPSKELEADKFSGLVMASLGATLEQAEAAMKAVSSDQASSTHPGKRDRLNAISLGWQSINKDGTVTPPTTPATPQDKTNASKYSDWVHLTNPNANTLYVELSDDGKNFQQVAIEAGKEFVFRYEIYNYGWIRVSTPNKGKVTYKLDHTKKYYIAPNRKFGRWDVYEDKKS
ncbi:MAG: hypothetical protein RLZZ628_2761 [Bacteroidota bacterium]|jgi:hypothetical protein